MNYLATHYWQSGEGSTLALVLQQAYHKKRKLPIVLAGIEEKRTREEALCQRLMQWFYRDCLTICAKHGEKGQQVLAESLAEVLQSSSCVGFAGVLCVGESILLFRKGKRGIYLLNTRNGDAECQKILFEEGEAEGEWCIEMGKIQQGVGLLLITNEFDEVFLEYALKRCLDVRKIKTQNMAQIRLREICTHAGEIGNADIGAVLIVSQ